MDIFEEAAVAAHKIESSDTGIISVSKDKEEVAGGMVAEILSMVLTGQVQLSIPPPEVLPSPRLCVMRPRSLLC